MRLLLVGPHPKDSRFSEEDLSEKRVVLTGAVPYESAPGYINASDILVAPYNPDADPLRRKYGIGWPLKVLEYMACEKPVISTRVPPLDKVIIDGVNGILVEPGNPGSLSDAILRLSSDSGLVNAIQANARLSVQTQYTWSKVASTFSDALDNSKVSQ